MAGMYRDAGAEQALIHGGDPLVYEVLQYDTPAESGQLVVCTTIVQPGKLGDEFFMTKGHCHAKRETGEVCLGLRGEGLLVMECGDKAAERELRPNLIAYVPRGWAHRSVNRGQEPLVFVAVYPADAGHDYESIERDGFRNTVVERDGRPTVVAAGQ
jgi:glucose-6-phosphate isomerase